MTRVDFYILEQQHAEARQRFACRLADKAWRQGHRVYIHTDGVAQSHRLNELLWSYRVESFTPHALDDDDDAAAEATPIHIGHGSEPRHHDEVLINLAPEVPLFFSRFARVIELVDQRAESRQQGRERFRFYRDRGYPLANHTLTPDSK
ncbi:MAG: DNA polymerase III subunit chi [Gammaproteobacteria bacterium]|nr:DNA polymerase III subunit chi [Gammaproteobacteria bacterium]